MPAMIRPLALLLALPLVAAPVLAQTPATATDTLTVASPDGRNVIRIVQRDGRLWYAVQRRGQNVIMPSALGFTFRGAPMLRDSLRITATERATRDTTFTLPWGEVARVRDHHNELRV